jgi:K+/H+ antiporter YhaU regulatory subunit KhtT
MANYGSSMALDDKLDLVVDDTGDIKTTPVDRNDAEELEKDLAYMTIAALDDILGSPVIDITEQTIRKTVRDIVLKDPRVERVQNVDVEPVTDNTPSQSPLDEYTVRVELRDSIQTGRETVIQI